MWARGRATHTNSHARTGRCARGTRARTPGQRRLEDARARGAARIGPARNRTQEDDRALRFEGAGPKRLPSARTGVLLASSWPRPQHTGGRVPFPSSSVSSQGFFKVGAGVIPCRMRRAAVLKGAGRPLPVSIDTDGKRTGPSSSPPLQSTPAATFRNPCPLDGKSTSQAKYLAFPLIVLLAIYAPARATGAT